MTEAVQEAPPVADSGEPRRHYTIGCARCKVVAQGSYHGTRAEVIIEAAADPRNSLQPCGDHEGIPVLVCSRCRRAAARKAA